MRQEGNTKNRRTVQINKLFPSQKDLVQNISKQMTELPQVNSCISTDSNQLQQVFSNQEITKESLVTYLQMQGLLKPHLSSSPTINPPKESGTLDFNSFSCHFQQGETSLFVTPPEQGEQGGCWLRSPQT